jgi:hypothetical protein
MDIILGAGVSIGGGITTVFRAAANGSVSWQHGNATVGRSPWCKFGAATAGENGRYAVFGGGNGNARRIELYDAGAWAFPLGAVVDQDLPMWRVSCHENEQEMAGAVGGRWFFAPHNLSFGREQVMAAVSLPARSVGSVLELAVYTTISDGITTRAPSVFRYKFAVTCRAGNIYGSRLRWG